MIGFRYNEQTTRLREKKAVCPASTAWMPAAPRKLHSHPMRARGPLDKLAVGETEAARRLPPSKRGFTELVNAAGSLPRPKLIGGRHARSPVARLEAVIEKEEFET
jgi:hypothetical protein